MEGSFNKANAILVNLPTGNKISFLLFDSFAFEIIKFTASAPSKLLLSMSFLMSSKLSLAPL